MEVNNQIINTYILKNIKTKCFFSGYDGNGYSDETGGFGDIYGGDGSVTNGFGQHGDFQQDDDAGDYSTGDGGDYRVRDKLTFLCEVCLL